MRGAGATPDRNTAVAEARETRGGVHLLRILGVAFGLAVIVGNTIGAGILRTPGLVAAQLPSAALVLGVWIVGGLYALIGALTVSELGAMLPRSGGFYVFAQRAFGNYLGFVVGWTDWLSQCGTTAAVAMVIGEYSGDLVPALHGRTVATACTATLVLAAAQWRGIRWGSLVQNITTTLKALAFLALIAAIFLLAPARPEVAHAAFRSGMPLFAALIVACQAVIYTYDGWYAVIYFGEEVRQPGRDIPRAMIGGVVVVMAIYAGVNAALLYAMPLDRIAGQDLALGAVAAAIFGPHGDTMIRAITIVSMLSGINAYHLMASRIPVAMARDDMVPAALGLVNRGGTPTVALAASAAAAVLFILTGSFERVAGTLALFFVADYALAYIAVFVLRRREPQLPRPFRVPGYPWTPALALMVSVAFVIGAIFSDTRHSLYSLAVLAGSYPLYLVLRQAVALRR
jgi:APA family basic amino acid/polyamine antiporter